MAFTYMLTLYPTPAGSPKVFGSAASQRRSQQPARTAETGPPSFLPTSASQSANSLPGTLVCDRTCLNSTSASLCLCTLRHNPRVLATISRLKNRETERQRRERERERETAEIINSYDRSPVARPTDGLSCEKRVRAQGGSSKCDWISTRVWV